MISLLANILGYLLLTIGTLFLLITALAMIRFPDFYTRLHAGTKCLTGGAIALLAGVIFLEGMTPTSLKLLFLILFLIITNPVTSHAIARSAYQVGLKPKDLVREDLYQVGDDK